MNRKAAKAAARSLLKASVEDSDTVVERVLVRPLNATDYACQVFLRGEDVPEAFFVSIAKTS